MSNTNNNNNIKPNSFLPPQQEEWFGGYCGGLLRWGSIRKQSQYIRRFRKKDNEVIRRILSTDGFL